MSETIRIDLGSGPRAILKVGFLIRASFILVFAVGAALLGLHNYRESLLLTLICFVICFVLFLVFYKLLNAAFFHEYIIVNKNEISVYNKNLSITNHQQFDISAIRQLGFFDQHYTKHPMYNPFVDITGLATQERELQYVIDEGKIKLVTDDRTFRFGKNMASWDVEELVEKIEQHTGRKFQRPELVADPENNLENQFEESAEELVEQQMENGFQKYTYTGDFGTLVISQKNEIPASEDTATLNGKTAPTGKYQIGEKQFVMISNGLIYAVRGFKE